MVDTINHSGISSFLVYDESFFQSPLGVVAKRASSFLGFRGSY